MKKFFVITILVLYFLITAFRVVNLHFCHGNLQSVAFSLPAEICCQATDEGHALCCEDVSIEVDFDRDHLYTQQIIVNPPLESEALPVDMPDIAASGYMQFLLLPDLPFHDHPPPKLFQLNHSYLFYG